ncbi:hypothetical protein ACP70R_040579 [Stipagrostis hirtigluma subsp. patula]
MVLMAGASDLRSTAKPKPAPASPSPSPTPAPASTSRLIGEGFPRLSWGAHRLLRCSKDGASSSPASAASPPPPHPHTPSPEKEKDKPHGSPGASQPPRPWNLRARRSATVAPLAPRSEAAGKAATAVAGQAQQPLALSPAAARKRAIALTKEEIAEDFDAIRGTRPPRWPKKRPRIVQRQVDILCPGLSLANVTLDLYKIEEVIDVAWSCK